jgi:hypothetical protein
VNQVATTRRRLEAEHQPRALKLQGTGQFDELHRISRTDETVITERVRAAEDDAANVARSGVVAELARLEGELRSELRRLRDPRMAIRRQTYRDLGQALTLIGRVRRALAPVS